MAFEESRIIFNISCRIYEDVFRETRNSSLAAPYLFEYGPVGLDHLSLRIRIEKIHLRYYTPQNEEFASPRLEGLQDDCWCKV